MRRYSFTSWLSFDSFISTTVVEAALCCWSSAMVIVLGTIISLFSPETRCSEASAPAAIKAGMPAIFETCSNFAQRSSNR